MNLLHTVHVPSGEGPFPTVIALHGWGASAHDLFGLAPLIHDGKALVLCPQGKVEMAVTPGQKGYGWFPLTPGLAPDPEVFRAAAHGLTEFLAWARGQYPIDPRRTALVGFSQGGLMAYAEGLSNAEHYAGLAGLSTWLPSALSEAIPKTAAQRELAALVIHGTADPLVDIERGRQSREALRDFGVSLMYREFAMGHEIRQEALAVILDWLERKVFGRLPG